jgi:DNA-binding MarR family transcriptional regulator
MEVGNGPEQANAPKRLQALPSRLLNLAAGYAQRQVGERLATLGARKWHYATLAALEEFGPDSQSGLSDRTCIYRSDMVATINELTARGFVVRAPDPGDRRRNAITITDEGRRHLKDLDVLIADAEGEFLAPLSDAERAELIRILKLIVYGHGSLAAVLRHRGFPVDDHRVGVGPDHHRHPGSWE